jgi:hypothetical protein
MIVSKRPQCALLALAAVLAAGAAGAQTAPPAQRPASAPSPKVDVLCGRNESECLKPLSGIATRDGDHLHLKLASGKVKTFTTTRQACEANIYEKCLQYRLAGYYSRPRHFLVDVAFLADGGTTFLVSSRTGEHIRIDAELHFSPSGRRIAAVSASELGGENSIEIWATTNDLPKSEWRYVVPDGEYSLYEFVGWDGDDRLKMRVTTRMGEEVYDSLPVEAIRTSTGWTLMPPIPEEGK